MKSKHGSNSDRDSSNDKGDTFEKNGDFEDSMSGNDEKGNKNGGGTGDKVDHDALSIYIGNVDYSATEEELRNTFIACGDIVRVTIIKNMKTGHPKGAAFIEFTDKEGVNAAMDLNGREVKGRPLIVTSKKPRPENRSREGRPNMMMYDRRPPRGMGGPPPYTAHAAYGGRPSYPGSNRGGSYGSYGGGMGGMDRRGAGGGGIPPIAMDNPMARMQPRYDPYRRPEYGAYAADPYMQMQRGGAGAPPTHQPYYHHQDKMGGNNGGGGGGMGGNGGNPHHQRAGPPQQRYSSNPFNRR